MVAAYANNASGTVTPSAGSAALLALKTNFINLIHQGISYSRRNS